MRARTHKQLRAETLMLDICRGELCVCICIASRVQKIISRIGDRRRFAHGAETEETTTKTANSVHTLTSTYDISLIPFPSLCVYL